MANGLLSSILSFIDQSKQSIGAKAGLLASNPQEYLAGINESARGFNRGQEAGLLADRNMMRGLPVTAEQMRAKQFADKQLEDFALGLVGNIKPVGKTQFDIANEIAQKNAVEMLGLPANNTAMDRAKAIGFSEGGYTGTNRDITLFDPSKAGASGSGSREGPLGTWLTNDPKVASGFADWSARGQGGNVVYPLMIRGKSPKEFGSYKEIKDLIDANTQFKRAPYRMMQDSISYENAKKSLGDYGVLRNTMTDAIDEPITQYVVPDPSRLRSKFAAFDPARIKEADLLAAGVPLGLLAGTEVELPKKSKVKAKK